MEIRTKRRKTWENKMAQGSNRWELVPAKPPKFSDGEIIGGMEIRTKRRKTRENKAAQGSNRWELVPAKPRSFRMARLLAAWKFGQNGANMGKHGRTRQFSKNKAETAKDMI
ncbi:MAG TPA: hypothetical protein VGO59_09175 [Verrucomicrobiae bacterium]|jgi:hypothetical protein